jgi:hypothetical protein
MTGAGIALYLAAGVAAAAVQAPSLVQTPAEPVIVTCEVRCERMRI